MNTKSNTQAFAFKLILLFAIGLDKFIRNVTAAMVNQTISRLNNLSSKEAYDEIPFLQRIAQVLCCMLWRFADNEYWQRLTWSFDLCLSWKIIAPAVLSPNPWYVQDLADMRISYESFKRCKSLMHVQAEVLREAALAGNAAASDLLCSKTVSPVMDWSQPLSNHPDLRGAMYAAISARTASCNTTTSKQIPDMCLTCTHDQRSVTTRYEAPSMRKGAWSSTRSCCCW